MCSIETAEKQYKDAFQDEYNSFLLRVHDRAQARLDKARAEAAEQEAEERQVRLPVLFGHVNTVIAAESPGTGRAGSPRGAAHAAREDPGGLQGAEHAAAEAGLC